MGHHIPEVPDEFFMQAFINHESTSPSTGGLTHCPKFALRRPLSQKWASLLSSCSIFTFLSKDFTLTHRVGMWTALWEPLVLEHG